MENGESDWMFLFLIDCILCTTVIPVFCFGIICIYFGSIIQLYWMRETAMEKGNPHNSH